MLALGFLWAHLPGRFAVRTALGLGCAAALALLAAAGADSTGSQLLQYDAASLPARTGRVEGAARIAAEGIDRPGLLNFGPYVRLGRGSYKLQIHYSSSAPTDVAIGTWDIYRSEDGTIYGEGPLMGTGGVSVSLSIPFRTPEIARSRYEFRNHWNGTHDIRLIRAMLVCR